MAGMTDIFPHAAKFNPSWEYRTLFRNSIAGPDQADGFRESHRGNPYQTHPAVG